MGTRLRKAKKDNKGIGGKGAGLVIRRHPDCVQSMKNKIWATYYHRSSSDEDPQHMYCPTGSSSWCKWQQAAANNTLEGFVHEHPPLDVKVLDIIKPIYTSLLSDDLLERCLGSETQNNNESLNSLIWTCAPKHIHAGTQTIETALMGIIVGTEAHTFAVRRNEQRIDRSELRASDASKAGRTARLEERSSQNLDFEKEEGPMYGYGIAD